MSQIYFLQNKGPLSISARSDINQTLPLASLLSIRTYKINLKRNSSEEAK